MSRIRHFDHQAPTATAVLIDTAFDPSLLPPGCYVATTASEAYEFARLGIEAGVLDVLGEKDEADGSTTLVFTPTHEGSTRPNSEALVGAIMLGPAYFQAPLREYQEWPLKWWREVIQNAVDAGARNVQLGTIKNEDGSYTVFCQDDGGGMSREVLFDKFLVMGGTTKEGGAAGTTGGFGKAKELILLPWLQWTVTSGRFTVIAPSGGASWRATESDTHYRGTRVEVRQPAGNHTTIEAAMEFLQRSWIPRVRFTLTHDGVPVETPKGFQTSNRDPIRTQDNMDIFFVETEDQRNYAWVRINGLFMFQRYVSDIKGQLVVELRGSSIENLTSNRDGFSHWSISNQLERYLSEVSKDTSSALKAKKGLFKKRYSQGLKTKADVPIATPFMEVETSGAGGKRTLTTQGVQDVVDQLTEQALGESPGDDSKAWVGSGGDGDSSGYGGSDSDSETDGDSWAGGSGSSTSGSSSGTSRKRFQGSGTPGGRVQALVEISSLQSVLIACPDLLEALMADSDRQLESALKQLSWRPDFIVMNEIENFKVPAKFLPETMSVGVIRLAKMWTEICRWVLMQLGCGEPFAVGFTFDESTMASYLKEDDENWLLLNPFATPQGVSPLLRRIGRGAKVAASDLEVLRVTEREDFRLLYALAVHECTHFANGINYHDEAFASAMTQNFARCADGMGQYRTLLNATASRRGPTKTPVRKAPAQAKPKSRVPTHLPKEEQAVWVLVYEAIPSLLTEARDHFKLLLERPSWIDNPQALYDHVSALYYAMSSPYDGVMLAARSAVQVLTNRYRPDISENIMETYQSILACLEYDGLSRKAACQRISPFIRQTAGILRDPRFEQGMRACLNQG